MIEIRSLAQFRSMHAWRNLRHFLDAGGDLRGVHRWAREHGYAIKRDLLRAAVVALRGGMATGVQLNSITGTQQLPRERWQRLRVIGAAYAVDVALTITDPDVGVPEERLVRLLFSKNPTGEEIAEAMRAEIRERQRRGTDPLFTGDDLIATWTIVEGYRRTA